MSKTVSPSLANQNLISNKISAVSSTSGVTGSFGREILDEYTGGKGTGGGKGVWEREGGS